MDGTCYLENAVYQANIFPKEGNFKEKIYIRVFSDLNGSLDRNLLLNLYTKN